MPSTGPSLNRKQAVRRPGLRARDEATGSESVSGDVSLHPFISLGRLAQTGGLQFK